MLAEGLRGFLNELVMVNGAVMLSYICNNQHAELDDLIASSMERRLKPGRLSYANHAEIEFDWGAAPSVALAMELRDDRLTAFFRVVFGGDHVGIDLRGVHFTLRRPAARRACAFSPASSPTPATIRTTRRRRPEAPPPASCKVDVRNSAARRIGRWPFTPIYVFDLAAQHARWATVRQAVVTGNIANANTAGYTARDVEPFSAVLDSEATGSVAMAETNPGHISATAILPRAAASGKPPTPASPSPSTKS